MTDLLDRAIERVRALPHEAQDEFARMLLDLTADETALYRLSVDEEASLQRARAEVARGEFAPEDRMRAIWSKHGL